MDRRGFLRLLGMAVPVAAVAPKYFFAPVGGWHSEVIANPNELPSSLWGFKYWHVNSNSGSFAGLERSAYPGRLSTPTIVLDGPLTASMMRGVLPRLEATSAHSLGYDA